MNQAVLDFMASRTSAPIHELAAPGPDDAQIAAMLTLAARVPDHGRLEPWRFILYRGQARIRIGEMLAARLAILKGGLTPGEREKELERFSRAPLVIGVVSSPKDNPKIPQWEMLLSAGAAAMNLLIAANAAGFGANWITNWYADDAESRAFLGMAPHERAAGFVHVGNHSGPVADRPRPVVANLVSEWQGPWAG